MANNTGTFFNINDNDGIPLVGVSTDGKVMINHLYGNCLIGSTSVTGTTSQPLQVTGGAYVSGNLGIGTTNPTVKLQVQGDGRFTGIITASHLNSTDVSVTGLTTTNNLYVAGVGTFLSSGLKIRNAANNAQYNITGGAIAADRTLNLPAIATTDTVATLGLTQTFTGSNTFSGFFSLSATSSNIYAVNLTTGVLSLGGEFQTGTMTLGQSTVSQITNIQAGASGVGTTKTINFGTSGLTSSFTQINIGPTAGVGTVVINSGTNLGIGTTNPTVKLDVVGNVNVLGIITASSFVGSLTGIASTATTALGFSTTASINTSGTITASSFVGSLVGIASTATTALGFSTTASINTTGIITATGGFNIGIQSGGTNITTGVITAINFIGSGNTFSYNSATKVINVTISGSGGSGISSVSISSNTTNQAQYIPYITSFGNTTGFGATTLLVYNPSSGNLGIGTTNPTSKLQVQGDGRFTGIITASSFDLIDASGTPTIESPNNLYLNATTVAISTNITIGGEVQSNLRVGSSYSVGIGTTNPTSKLHVVGDGRFTGIITASTLNIGTGGTVFTTTAIGNIGIGTTNPTVKLQVQGDANISGILTASKVASGIISNSKVSAYILQKSDVGKYISISSGGVTVPSGIFSEGDVISIYNNSASNQTITQGTSVTMYFSGTSTTGNRTLSQRGLSTILCVGTNTFIIGGAGLL
jgi:hypothetical protein